MLNALPLKLTDEPIHHHVSEFCAYEINSNEKHKQHGQTKHDTPPVSEFFLGETWRRAF